MVDVLEIVALIAVGEFLLVKTDIILDGPAILSKVLDKLEGLAADKLTEAKNLVACGVWGTIDILHVYENTYEGTGQHFTPVITTTLAVAASVYVAHRIAERAGQSDSEVVRMAAIALLATLIVLPYLIMGCAAAFLVPY
ncbi:hypothetical protein LTR17_003344 [Elasticomyces elasticus]|nr:hypothetical protein LTR17_003344 [Elasticomyces elasticus]